MTPSGGRLDPIQSYRVCDRATEIEGDMKILQGLIWKNALSLEICRAKCKLAPQDRYIDPALIRLLGDSTDGS